MLYGWDKRLPTFLLERDVVVPPLCNYDDYVETRTRRTREMFKRVRSTTEKMISMDHQRPYKEPSVEVGTKCYILNEHATGPMFKVNSKFVGPFRIQEDLGKGKFLVKSLEDGAERNVHWNKLKLIKRDIDPFFVEKKTDESTKSKENDDNFSSLQGSSEDRKHADADCIASQTRAKIRLMNYMDLLHVSSSEVNYVD